VCVLLGILECTTTVVHDNSYIFQYLPIKRRNVEWFVVVLEGNLMPMRKKQEKNCL